MGEYTIRTQDNRGDWKLRWYISSLLRRRYKLTVQRWRPSLLWRVMHRLGAC